MSRNKMLHYKSFSNIFLFVYGEGCYYSYQSNYLSIKSLRIFESVRCCMCMYDGLCLLKVVLKLALGESHVVKEVGSGSSLS